MKTGKPKIVRKINRNLVLDVIRNKSYCTKTYIAKKVGISKQTVNKIVTNLIKEKLVLEVGLGESTDEGGKRPILLKFNPKAGFVIGLILTSKIEAILTNLEANILFEKTIPIYFKRGHKDVVSNMIKLIKDIINRFRIETDGLLGIGIGVSGVTGGGRVKMLPRFMDWKDFPLTKIIADEVRCKVFIDNIVRLESFGEKWFGLAKGVDNFATIYVGKGLGTGFFHNNKSITGYNYLSGEIGHIKLKKNGPKCGCGSNGCFETLVNIGGIRRIFDEKSGLGGFEDSLLYKKFKNNNLLISPEELFSSFYEGDNLSKMIVDEISYWLGIGISIIISTLDPKLIIINGPYSSGGDYFISKITEEANKNFLPNISKEINIKYSKLGEKAGLIGAVGMVLDRTL